MMSVTMSVVVFMFLRGLGYFERCRAAGYSGRGDAGNVGASFRFVVALRIKPVFPAIYHTMAISTFEIRAMASTINRSYLRIAQTAFDALSPSSFWNS